MNDERLEMLLYGNPGGNNDPGNVKRTVGEVFDSLAKNARMDNDPMAARALEGEAEALVTGMNKAGFSGNAAREFSNILREYAENPRDAEVLKKQWPETEEDLRKAWQEKAPKMLRDARALIASLGSKSPSLARVIANTGVSEDIRILKLAGEIARYRRETKK